VATFEQLPADQRAIIELVLKRGRSYDSLSDMLAMPSSRVRELARDALVELAPHTAGRVDPDWQAQVADYVLGQQSGAESAATQGHLRRSEPARAWLLSLMDSLDQLYANGSRPELPEADDRPRARDRKGRERALTVVPSVDDDEASDKDDAKANDAKPAAAARAPSRGRDRDTLSPAARAVVRRRRIIGASAVLAILVLAVLLLTGAFSSDKKSSDQASAKSTNTTASTPPTQLVGELQLNPVGNQPAGTAGLAAIAVTGNKTQLAIQAKLPPTKANQAYEVWLYNSPKDAVSIGAQRTDAQGNYSGAGEIPSDFQKWKYVDVSLETIDRNAGHSGTSVLRGALADMQAPTQQQGGAGTGGAGGSGGAGGAGTTTAP
jgi:hypothetical protein